MPAGDPVDGRLSAKTARPLSRFIAAGERLPDKTSFLPPIPMPLLNKLLDRRVVIVTGKGGVGKTAFSAALAMVAAERGTDTLALESDPGAPLATAFGKKWSLTPVEVAPHLETMGLDGGRALEEYLRLVVPGRMVLNAVFSSRLYQYFVQAAPGLRELMMLGKIYFEATKRTSRRSPGRLLIFDAPASGQVISLLKMPAAARETFAHSIVGREAANIHHLLHNERECALVQITTPDTLALSETLETSRAFGSLGFKVFSVVLNRYSADFFSKADVAKFVRRSVIRSQVRHIGHLSAVARNALRRSANAREALETLARQVESPLVRLPEFRGSAGLELYRKLVSALLCDRYQQIASL